MRTLALLSNVLATQFLRSGCTGLRKDERSKLSLCLLLYLLWEFCGTTDFLLLPLCVCVCVCVCVRVCDGRLSERMKN